MDLPEIAGIFYEQPDLLHEHVGNQVCTHLECL